ncbi:MAG: hypothetical protein K2P86_07455 [Xanthobacteraceae bacterium]|nr:hypothetical protein [Xanthobacteraceae bacterium]
MTDLSTFQRKVALVLTALSALHVPVLVMIAWALERDGALVSLAALGFAAVPVMLFFLNRPVTAISFALAVTLVGQTSLLVYLFDGHPWQVEMHFYYFALLACCPVSATGACCC